MSLKLSAQNRYRAVRLASIGLFFLSSIARAVEVGQQAPDVDLEGAGLPPRLSQLAGKVVYLDFWASWCAPCRQSFPWMNDMHRKYAAKGLKIVGVNLDGDQDDAEAFMKQVPTKFAVSFDPKGQSVKGFGIKGMPTAVLIGRDGKILHVQLGWRPTDHTKLEAKLAAALSR